MDCAAYGLCKNTLHSTGLWLCLISKVKFFPLKGMPIFFRDPKEWIVLSIGFATIPDTTVNRHSFKRQCFSSAGDDLCVYGASFKTLDPKKWFVWPMGCTVIPTRLSIGLLSRDAFSSAGDALLVQLLSLRFETTRNVMHPMGFAMIPPHNCE